jgi:IclR family transcriptional regulator, acetate operon repressor
MARTTTPKSKVAGVRAVERAIDILEAFSDARSSMSVLEIQEAVGLSRPTLYRMLETLASKGFIRAHGTPQRFSLDYGVGRLARNWLSGLDPVTAARPILKRLHEESGESVGLMMIRSPQYMCVVELPSLQPLAISRGAGRVAPLGFGASGKVMLAYADDETLKAALRMQPKDTNRKRLLNDLAKIRYDGFRVSRGEVFAGAISVAAPYFDHAHRVLGTIAVYGPDVRVTDEWVARMTKRVLAGTAELSAALGDKSSAAMARPMLRAGQLAVNAGRARRVMP